MVSSSSIQESIVPTVTAHLQESELPTNRITPSSNPEESAEAEPSCTPKAAQEKDEIAISVEDGTSFDTETLEVELELPDGQAGSYRVDHGVSKKFVGSTTVTVGEGKIADTDVTLSVTAGGKTKTYTYKKVFNKEKAAEEQQGQKTIKASISRVIEKVEEAAQVDSSFQGEPTSKYFRTNPGNQTGAKKMKVIPLL